MRLELTRRADYGIRAMLALARVPDGERRSVRRIASEQRIPVRFLPAVMRDLVGAGLVEAIPGRIGGYRLDRSADTVTLLDIVVSVEGDRRRTTCVLRGGPCATSGVCDVHEVFNAAQDDLLARLAGTTVADLIKPA